MLNQAKWIWCEPVYDVNEYADFIQEFTLKTADSAATLHISADSEYMLYINSVFVGTGQYSDFPENKTYDTFKIGNYLKTGKNKITVTAYFQGEETLRYKRGERGLIYALQNGNETVFSSKETLCRISRTYKSGVIHLTTTQMGFGFAYDASKDDGFHRQDYIITGEWENALEKEVQTHLSKRPILKLDIAPPCATKITAQGNFIRKSDAELTSELMYSDYLSYTKFDEFFEGSKHFPVRLRENDKTEDGIYFIVDLGRESCGYLDFALTASAGTRIDIAHGEHLTDLRVRSKIAYRNFADTYICAEGRQTFTHYTRRIACRYIQVHISNFSALSVDYFGIRPLSYPFSSEATFTCSDSLHNKIFATCLDTLKLCMHEHYEDCPWREQALYGSDSRNASACAHYTLGGSFAFTRASLDLLARSVLDDSYVNLCAPAGNFKTIPSFTMLWFLAVKEYTDFSGDITFAKEHWSLMQKMISSITSSETDGILKPVPVNGVEPWNYYEWSSDQYELHTLLTEKGNCIRDGLYHIFAYMALSSALWLAKELGDTDFEKKYTPFARNMKTVFNQKFYDAEKGIFSSHIMDGKPFRFDELTQSLAVFSGICDADKTDRVLAALANPDNGLIKLSLSYLIYKYEALLTKGMQYAPVVFEEIAEKWGDMLLTGSTSFWETEQGSETFGRAGSLCHAWSATPIIVYCKYVLGVHFENGNITVDENAPCSSYFSSFKATLPVWSKPITK